MFSGSYQWDMYLYRTTKLGGSRKCKIQDCGLHPWNAYISPPRIKRIWYYAKVLQHVHSITFWIWNHFFGLTAAILDFRILLTSDNIFLSAIELAILENMVGAFWILILSYLQAEIHALPVWRRPSWISDFRLRREVLGLVPLSCWTSKMWEYLFIYLFNNSSYMKDKDNDN